MVSNFSRPVLLLLASAYVLSGVDHSHRRGIVRRRLPQPQPPTNRSIKLADSLLTTVPRNYGVAERALVGGDSLLAREVRELLERGKPAPHIELISGAAKKRIPLF